jgi:hypothetical protein
MDRRRSVSFVAALALAGASVAAAPQAARPGAPDTDILEAQRLEGQAILALADAAMARSSGRGRASQAEAGAAPADFRIRWRNEFLKAQQGTFVPFTLDIDAADGMPPAALVYVRAVPRGGEAPAVTGRRSKKDPRGGAYPVDAIFPVELDVDGGGTAHVSRGFSIAPGDYDIYVVVRERSAARSKRSAVRAGVLATSLDVPDFWTGELTTSSVIVADRIRGLSEPVSVDDLPERPYAIGQNEVVPAPDTRFRPDEELIVLLLVYNPTVAPDKRFDLQVEYHFFQAGAAAHQGGAAPLAAGIPPVREGERYFNRTEPQRFNRALMGTAFDPAAGHPVLAGQEVPLAGFADGEYRLAIKVTDMLSGRFVLRDVHFTVGS